MQPNRTGAIVTKAKAVYKSTQHAFSIHLAY